MEDLVKNERFTRDARILEGKLVDVALLLEEAAENIKNGGEQHKGVGFYTDAGFQTNPDGN